jgi:spore coat protein U-like protein
LKKLMMLAAMLALVLAIAAPAIAQVTNAVGQESETGDFTATFTATQSGNSSSQCVRPLQFGNTAPLQNGQAVLQYSSSSGDIGEGGSTFTFSPSLTGNCEQTVQQASAASSN